MFKCLVTCSTLYHAVLFRYVHCIMTGLVFLMVLLSRMFYTHTQSPWVARVGHSFVPLYCYYQSNVLFPSTNLTFI